MTTMTASKFRYYNQSCIFFKTRWSVAKWYSGIQFWFPGQHRGNSSSKQATRGKLCMLLQYVVSVPIISTLPQSKHLATIWQAWTLSLLIVLFFFFLQLRKWKSGFKQLIQDTQPNKLETSLNVKKKNCLRIFSHCCRPYVCALYNKYETFYSEQFH